MKLIDDLNSLTMSVHTRVYRWCQIKRTVTTNKAQFDVICVLAYQQTTVFLLFITTILILEYNKIVLHSFPRNFVYG